LYDLFLLRIVAIRRGCGDFFSVWIAQARETRSGDVDQRLLSRLRIQGNSNVSAGRSGSGDQTGAARIPDREKIRSRNIMGRAFPNVSRNQKIKIPEAGNKSGGVDRRFFSCLFAFLTAFRRPDE